MGEGGLASGKKNVARLGASLIFLDETGLLMAPLVRRSWAPRGQTPILYQRTRSWEKVSVIVALAVSPKRRRVTLYFNLYPGANVNGGLLVSFLEELTEHIGNPMVLVWDNLSSHRGRPVADFLERHSRVWVEWLPAYAPELNPVEYLNSYLKLNPLANLAALGAAHLATLARPQLHKLQKNQPLLRSFIHASPLSLRLR